MWVENGRVPYDAVLLVGTCMVDESSLTGEPDPVRKAPFQNAGTRYEPDGCQANTLFTGTLVLHVSHLYTFEKHCRDCLGNAHGERSRNSP